MARIQSCCGSLANSTNGRFCALSRTDKPSNWAAPCGLAIKSTSVIFVKQLEVPDREHPGETKTVPMLRSYAILTSLSVLTCRITS